MRMWSPSMLRLACVPACISNSSCSLYSLVGVQSISYWSWWTFRLFCFIMSKAALYKLFIYGHTCIAFFILSVPTLRPTPAVCGTYMKLLKSPKLFSKVSLTLCSLAVAEEVLIFSHLCQSWYCPSLSGSRANGCCVLSLCSPGDVGLHFSLFFLFHTVSCVLLSQFWTCSVGRNELELLISLFPPFRFWDSRWCGPSHLAQTMLGLSPRVGKHFWLRPVPGAAFYERTWHDLLGRSIDPNFPILNFDFLSYITNTG